MKTETVMKKRMINFILSALLFLPLVSCVEDIVIDMGSEEAIAVDCVLRKQRTQTLRLYEMNEVYGSRGEKGVEEATVCYWPAMMRAGSILPPPCSRIMRGRNGVRNSSRNME